MYCRSLAKYSSEEESDEDARMKRDKSRRATIGTSMLPPAASKSGTRKSTRSKVDVSHNDEDASVSESSSRVTTETKSRRTTRLIKPVLEADLETGSDSEPEIVEEYTRNDDVAHSTRASTSFTAGNRTIYTHFIIQIYMTLVSEEIFNIFAKLFA